VSLDAAFIAAQ